jgi:hypothetical protein
MSMSILWEEAKIIVVEPRILEKGYTIRLDNDGLIDFMP